MDISGVDVDYLNDEEILELCSDIVDSNNEEKFVLNGIDVNNLSDDKVQEIYDNIISLNSVPIQYEQETSEINNDIVDQNSDEILLINGYNVNFENLSDDEILTYYEDIIDNGDLIAVLYCYFTEKVSYFYNSTYKSTDKKRYFACNDSKYSGVCKSAVTYGHSESSDTYWIPGYYGTTIGAYCSGYHAAKLSFYGMGQNKMGAYYIYMSYTCSNICK